MKKAAIYLLSITGTLAISAQTSMPNPSVTIEEDITPYVNALIVSNDGSHRLKQQTINIGENLDKNVDGEISLNVNDRKQTIDGFGFAITGSAGYNLLKMDEGARKKLLTQIFSPEHGYGCNYVRIPIGCSDFSLSEYTCCDTPGIENFGLTVEENDYIIPVMKEILAINPDVKVISAPWTAPRWMKTNGDWTSGNLKVENYQDYGEYFVKWIKAFEDNGIKIYGVTPQNEPLNRGNSASMYMGWEEQRDFIKNALGPKFSENGIDTKIYVFDHNYNYDNIREENHYPVKIYNDADASRYIAGSAYHNYGGHASEMSYVHNQNPEKELIFTEWTAGTWSWPGVGMEAVTTDAQALIFDVLNNWGQGSVVWNLMLDSERGPYRPGGCSTGNGAIDINIDGYDELTFNSFYYVICLAASAVSDNARYITTDGTAADIQIVAFENTDGYGAIIMNTSNDEKNIKLKENGNQFIATIPPYSLASYRW